MSSSGHHQSMSPRLRLPAVAAALAVALSGCSGSSSSSGDAGPSESPASSPTSEATQPSPAAKPYLPVPKGVHLTAPGSELKFDQHAVVAWRPKQQVVGVLKVTVKGAQQVSISRFKQWDLPAATKQSTPYFVHVQLKNLGRSNLTGYAVPLYVLDKRGVLLESSRFQSTFKPCPSGPFPARFKHGAKKKACLVYFAPKHGSLKAVSFRPTEKFLSIDWTGHVNTPAKKKHKKPLKR